MVGWRIGANGASPPSGNVGAVAEGQWHGGTGGILWVVYHTLSNSGTISANGGAGGAAGRKVHLMEQDRQRHGWQHWNDRSSRCSDSDCELSSMKKLFLLLLCAVPSLAVLGALRSTYVKVAAHFKTIDGLRYLVIAIPVAPDCLVYLRRKTCRSEQILPLLQRSWKPSVTCSRRLQQGDRRCVFISESQLSTE